jgi:hypothetical protein
MSRGIWFVAGAGFGIYAMAKTRRAAEALTPDGLRDRFAGLALGATLLSDDVRTEMGRKETELRDRLGLGLDEHHDGRRLESTKDRPLQLTRKVTD